MAILNFPDNPRNGDQYTGSNGTTYIYDGVKWVGHAAGGAAGTNSIQNGSFIIQVDVDGNLVLPVGSIIKDADGNPVAGADTGSITFADINIYGATSMDFASGGITLVPNRDSSYTNQGQYLNIYPTNNQDAPHIHIAAGTGGESNGDLILGDDTHNVDINHDGSIRVRASNEGGWQQWMFNGDGSIGFPNSPTNNRTGSADALVFTKSSTQKSIATQGGTSGQHTVERLVIAGGDGYYDTGSSTWDGEGGDIYLWAGRGSNGGDIKVDAGNSLSPFQEGGTIKIRGGQAQTGGVGGSIIIEAGSSPTENGEVDISGQNLYIATRNAVRNNYYSWTFDSDGVLRSTNNTLIVDGDIRANYGSSASLSGANTGRSSANVVFLNADDTSRTVYTVNGSIYPLYGIDGLAVYQVTVYVPGVGQYTPTSVTVDSETLAVTFTFGSAITLQGSTQYLVDWFYPDLNGVEIDAGNSYWWFDPDGTIYLPQGGEFGEKHWQTTISAASFGLETIITLTANEFTMPESGQVQISGVPGGHPLNGTWYFQTVYVNIIQLFSFEDYSAPINSTGWDAWAGGGTVQLSKEVVLKTNGHEWKFGNDGSTNFPNGKQVSFDSGSGSYIQAGDGTPYLTNGLNLVGGENGVAVVIIDNTDPTNAVDRNWSFKKDGSLQMPYKANGPYDSCRHQHDASQSTYVIANANPTVVFTSDSGDVDSIKALVKVISRGNPTGNGPTVTTDTQLAEIMITVRSQSYDGGPAVKTAVASVYGVTHTSDTPLATFTVNLIQGFGVGSLYGPRDVIQILAEPTAAVPNQMVVQVVATELITTFTI